MPIMWFAKDGSRPTSQVGGGTSITTEEVRVVFGSYQVEFVGAIAPSINRHKPTHSVKNVVFEIETSGEVSSLLPKVGYYVVVDLTPLEAQRELERFRGNNNTTEI